MFIAFEGIDGCGKSTVLEAVARRLDSEGRGAPLCLREPGSTPLGERVRAALLDLPDHESVIRFLDDDPFYKAGLFSDRAITVWHPVRVSLDALSNLAR